MNTVLTEVGKMTSAVHVSSNEPKLVFLQHWFNAFLFSQYPSIVLLTEKVIGPI